MNTATNIMNKYAEPFNTYKIDFKYIIDEMQLKHFYYGIYYVAGHAPLRCWEEFDDSDWRNPVKLDALQKWEIQQELTKNLEKQYNELRS